MSEKGKVYLVGAGSGDPELLTLKAAKVLAKADVVLYDRLVSAEILNLASPDAQIIKTAKQRNIHATPQSEINELIVQYAQKGNTVVRLKGGDVSFFSNVLDELETLTQQEIQYEIIPGVTAASGAAAYAGIPLTARNLSDEVHFLSFHNAAKYDEIDWAHYASLRGTLVLYMSAARIAEICSRLVQNGITDKPLAIIEQATTPFQKVITSTVFAAQTEFQERHFASPSLTIIGDVVRLSEKFDWFKGGENGLYFEELICK